MNVIASSFADPADIVGFKRAKARGLTDLQAFKFGDNGIGCWGDNTAQDDTCMVALPPDDMITKFGSVAKAKHAGVYVTYKNKRTLCQLADRMPWKKNIKNGAGIDLNPAAMATLGIPKGAMVSVNWEWD